MQLVEGPEISLWSSQKLVRYLLLKNIASSWPAAAMHVLSLHLSLCFPNMLKNFFHIMQASFVLVMNSSTGRISQSLQRKLLWGKELLISWSSLNSYKRYACRNSCIRTAFMNTWKIELLYLFHIVYSYVAQYGYNWDYNYWGMNLNLWLYRKLWI